jgi:hypothetical protein
MSKLDYESQCLDCACRVLENKVVMLYHSSATSIGTCR